MKHISTLAFIFVFFFSGLAQNQEINQPENIAEFGWNTENGLPYIKSTDVNYGVSSFELLPSGEIAFLNQKDNRIDIYNNVSEKFVTAIKLNVPASDFTYYNNMFYVLSRKNVVVISETGEILKTIQIPASVQVAEYLRVVDGQLCVLTPAGETIRISDNETDIFQGWIVKKDVYLKTAVSDNGTFQLQSFNGRKPTESKSYHLSTKISSARIIGLVNDMALIDAASIVSEKPLRVKREIVAVSLVNGAPGELIGSIELPNMYYIHTKHDLFTNSDGLFFLLTTPDKAVVYKIPIETNGVSPVLPQFLPAILQQFYHYNDHLLEEPNDGQGMINSDQQTERAPILRSQMIANAEPYETHVWYCNANNILNYSCGGVTVETPAWVQVGYNVSVPYCWGGWSSLPNYDQGLLNGVSAGDCNCVGSGSGESCAVGVDCSGFVSRAWNLPNKYGTSTLPNISTEYVSYSQLLPGDIVNYAGHHVRLVHTLNTDGSFLMIEASASATNWSVGYASYTVTNLQGYYLPRYYVDVVNDPLDTVAPQTAVTAPVWATDDFSATFADSDNDSVSRHFMLVSDFDGTEWRANGDYGYFNDNFSSAIHPDWTVVDGSWAIAGGALNQSNEALSADNIYAAVQQDSGYAYLYHWKMKITGSGTNRRGGIYFFSDDPTLLQRNNAYMIYYKADGDAIEIYKSINNSISLMNSSSCVIDADTWFDCKVIFNQPTGDIWVFRNDDFVAAWKDASPHTSGIAISCRNGGSNMFYDDMQVFRSRSMAAFVSLGQNGAVRFQNPSAVQPSCAISSIVIDASRNLSQIETGTVNIDWTPPDTVSFVFDGIAADQDTTHTNTALACNWGVSADVNSGITNYWYALGSTPGGSDIAPWTDNGNITDAMLNALALSYGTTYYFMVKALNGAGLESDSIVSDGITPEDVSGLFMPTESMISIHAFAGKIVVESGNLHSMQIQIFGNNGQLVFSTNSQSGKSVIDTGFLPSGIYFVKAMVDDVTGGKKFFVE